eukprot:673263-Pelagomonas_calceolata.AAC.5
MSSRGIILRAEGASTGAQTFHEIAAHEQHSCRPLTLKQQPALPETSSLANSLTLTHAKPTCMHKCPVPCHGIHPQPSPKRTTGHVVERHSQLPCHAQPR